SETDREVGRYAHLPESILDGFHRFADRDLGLSVDARHALHVLAVNLHGAGFTIDGEDVLGRYNLTGGRAQEHVADVRDLLPIGFAQPDDNRVLAAARTE